MHLHTHSFNFESSVKACYAVERLIRSLPKDVQ